MFIYSDATSVTQPGSVNQSKGAISGKTSGTTPNLAGVNRRTAVLFGNKRRPGRPPKIVPHEPAPDTAADNDRLDNCAPITGPVTMAESGDTANADNLNEISPPKKKRGRKKRSVEPDMEGGGFSLGSRWSEKATASGMAEWSTTASGSKLVESREANKSTVPPKESFRQYRDMYDSDDAKTTHKVEKEKVASSSSSEDSSGSSDNDDDDDDDEDSSSSAASDDDELSADKRGE